MSRAVLTTFGLILVLLGSMGLLLPEKQLFGFYNIDTARNMINIFVGLCMLYAGTQKVKIRTVGYFAGAVFLVLFAAGLYSPDLFGFVRHGLSSFDNFTHLVVGATVFYDARKRSKTLERIFQL